MRGFLTYSRQNDQIRPGQRKGEVTLFREAMEAALGQVEGAQVTLFQDECTIGTSHTWAHRIHEELEQVGFVVAILSQSMLRSKWCCHEVDLAEGRAIPVFPVYWIRSRLFEQPELISSTCDAADRDRVAGFQKRLAKLQYSDRRALKNKPYDDPEVLDFNDRLAHEISDRLAAA